MLQPLSPELISARDGLRSEAPKSPASSLLGIVRRQFLIILVGLSLATGVGAFFALATRPIYTASATMMIDSRTGGIQQKSVLGDSSPMDTAWVDSQIGILSLERGEIAQSIAEKLHLGSDPTIFGPTGALGGDLITPFASVSDPQKGDDNSGHASEEERTRQAASIIAGGIDVKRVGFSYLVNINFSAHGQDDVVKIVNAAADAYVAAEMKAKYDSLRQASDWLQERYQTLRDQASAAERAVVEFKSKNNIITAGGKLMSDQQLAEINDRLGAARAKTADEQARLDQIESVVKNQEVNGTFDTTVPDALLNPIVTKLRGQYLDLINKEADWSKRFGPNHQAVVNLRNQARDIRNSTHEELKRIAESYRSDLEIAKKNETELEKQLAAVVASIPNDAQISLRALETTAQSYRTFYDNFFQHYTESIQQQSSPIPETRVVSYAGWAYKSNSSPARTIVMAMLSGLALGLGFAVLRETMDKALRTGTQAQNAFQLDCLALIPATKGVAIGRAREPKLLPNRNKDSSREIFGDRDHADQRIMNSSAGALRFLVDAPLSPFAEAIRALKMSADLRGGVRGGGAKVIGITSSIPREGKSTIATALAGLVGHIGARAILLDCDLRNPALTHALAPNATVGLFEVISGQESLENSIWTDLETGLDFLPAVNVSRMSNTDQILAGEPMKDLFETLRRSYDYIIVDLSPLLPVVDVRATTGLIDFYIFLIEWGQTRSDVIHQALKISHVIYGNILGFAFNKVNMNLIGRYEGNHVRYYGYRESA